MALVDDIYNWSHKTLKPWQQDALRRLFQQTVDANSIGDFYAMLKTSVGIEVADKRLPEPLAKEHLPATATKSSSTILLSIRDIQNVNRLAPSQTIKFSPQGITVIYGGNGAGKSGYARVLKRACGARDLSEDVRPNAMDKASAGLIPEATFDVEHKGKSGVVKWLKNQPAPTELSTIAVFDTHCARAYLDQQQEIAYLPFGLDVVENLAQIVLPRVADMLNAEIANTLTDKTAFDHLLGNTNVSKLINGLSEKTSLNEVETLAQMNEAEKKRLEELKKTLSEIDPKTKSKELRQAIVRINALAERVQKSHNWVKEESIQKFKSLDEETELAIVAEVEAANVLRAGDDLLPGTGESTWKSLFNSAKKYSDEEAYPKHKFPNNDADSKCVLCQQTLSGESIERLNRFNTYIQADIAKKAHDSRMSRNNVISSIEAASLGFEHAPLIDELNDLSPDIVIELNQFETALQNRQQWMLASQKSNVWNPVPTLTIDPTIKLKAIADKLGQEADTYEKATDDKQKENLKQELDELIARESLNLVKQSITDLIARMAHKAKLHECKKDLATKPISDKAKEFASNTVTEPLRAALKREFSVLGVEGAIPRLDESVEKGKMKHKLQLDLVHHAQIRDILSEGEQRAIAIGSFLAELEIGGHEGGIVFDDPVSSLDHTRRINVARRLVEESKKRQVIIFTHDTAFLSELNALIEESKVDSLIHHLQWAGPSSGKVFEGLPWHHKSVKDRLDILSKNQIELAKIWPTYPDEEQSSQMRRQYGLIRATIERLIQDLVFNGVVVRYRDWIKVGSLSGVVGFDSKECDEIERIHKKCCDVTEAHDPSSGKNSPVPTAQNLGEDLKALEALISTIQSRKNAAKKPAP